MKSRYELLNDEAVNALKRMSEAVGARDTEIVDYYDKEVKRLLAEMKVEVRR